MRQMMHDASGYHYQRDLWKIRQLAAYQWALITHLYLCTCFHNNLLVLHIRIAKVSCPKFWGDGGIIQSVPIRSSAKRYAWLTRTSSQLTRQINTFCIFESTYRDSLIMRTKAVQFWEATVSSPEPSGWSWRQSVYSRR